MIYWRKNCSLEARNELLSYCRAYRERYVDLYIDKLENLQRGQVCRISALKSVYGYFQCILCASR